MSYKVGRRFEYHVVYKLRALGFEAKRVTLSGKKSEFYPKCDIIVKTNNRELKGKLKTTKKRNYVSIPIQDFIELSNGEIDFLCFGFLRSSLFFIINKIVENLEIVEKCGKKYISFSKKDVEKLPKKIYVKELNKYFLLVSLYSFIEEIKK